MNVAKRIAPLLIVLSVIGCASSKVTNREIVSPNEKIARPGHILVYDFAATPTELPPDSALAGQVADDGPKQTPEQVEAGHKLGGQIAKELAAEIRVMGLPGVQASSATVPRIGDIVIRGYLFSIDEGSATKRVLVGFGSGGAELKTAVEGYLMTEQGLRKLGSGTVDAGGGKAPGMVVPAAVAVATANPIGLIVVGGMKVYGEVSGSSKVEARGEQTAKEIAEELKPRFQQQGWIK